MKPKNDGSVGIPMLVVALLSIGAMIGGCQLAQEDETSTRNAGVDEEGQRQDDKEAERGAQGVVAVGDMSFNSDPFRVQCIGRRLPPTGRISRVEFEISSDGQGGVSAIATHILAGGEREVNQVFSRTSRRMIDWYPSGGVAAIVEFEAPIPKGIVLGKDVATRLVGFHPPTTFDKDELISALNRGVVESLEGVVMNGREMAKVTVPLQGGAEYALVWVDAATGAKVVAERHGADGTIAGEWRCEGLESEIDVVEGIGTELRVDEGAVMRGEITTVMNVGEGSDLGYVPASAVEVVDYWLHKSDKEASVVGV